MASEEDILKEIGKIVEQSAEKFNATQVESDKRVFDAISEKLKDLDVKAGRISVSVKNLNLIGKIVKGLRKTILDKEYMSNLKTFISAFDDIYKLQNQYFGLLEEKFKVTPLLQAIREEAIESTIQQLTDDKVNIGSANVRDVLRQNITTGGSYKDMMQTMSKTIIGTEGPDKTISGGISAASKTATITSVAQYSRHYSESVASGLNFTWFQYVGSTITTTRCFCHAMVEKRYFHISEIPDLLKGNFKEFEKKECDLNGKTGLPDGMIPGTNASNFMTYAGGYNCQHSIFPVPASRVPAELRALFEVS
jgi:hypothetical protein